MPTSRRRPAAARKIAASRRPRQGQPSKALGFTEAPWTTWQRVLDDPTAPAGALAVIEDTPFRLGYESEPGATVTLAQLCEDAGTSITELISAQQWTADQGFLRWDPGSRTAILCVPA